MKKILLAISAVIVSMTASAQVIRVYDTKTSTTTPVATYINSDDHSYKATLEGFKNVTGITVTGVNVPKTETRTFTTTVTPTNATIPTVTWSSSNSSIATVNATTGVVKGVAEGTTTITATATDGSGVTGSYEVTVTYPYVDITYDGTTTRWSKINLGATALADSPDAFGDYYACGAEQKCYNGTISYTWNNDHFDATITNGCSSESYSWNDRPSVTSETLSASQDIASITMGNNWRMPTQTEVSNLFAACGHTDDFTPTSCTKASDITSKGVYWIEYNEAGIQIGDNIYKIPGALFVPDKDKLNDVLFFPAAGDISWGSVSWCASQCHYWTSTLNSAGSDYAHSIYANKNNIYVNYSNADRFYGYSIRPVQSVGE